jgi:HAE1 family hydrophobic/amphiphilic exporter-1
VQAEGDFRTRPQDVGQFCVLNMEGDEVPLSALVSMAPTSGPEFTIRFNQYRAAQLNVSASPAYTRRR